ncbi:hypothetical protein LCGC14_0944710 [marine sediment metagenome]|uniref:Uncharacterized protein n=1 Tax=marine sediment metagenome TaxID=412755 RepID=A0A0F9R2K8_9ZZZZ
MNNLKPATRNLQPITVPVNSPFLPESLKARIRTEGNVIHVTRFSKAERQVMRTKPWMWPSEWAPKNRVMTIGPFAGRPWQSHITPYLDGVMDVMAFPSIQEFTLLKSVQSGGSDAVHNFIGWCIEYLKASIMYVYPDINTGRENAQDRIIAMIEKSKTLAKYLTGVDDDVTKFRIKLAHMLIYIGWATSPARMGNKPIRVMVFDETEYYPDVIGKKYADPISEGEKRTTTFGDSKKIIYLSVPALDTGFIVKKFKSAQAIFDYHVVCPDCGQEQIMVFKNIKWPRVDAATGELIDPADIPETAKRGEYLHPDPDRMKAEKLAWYECEHCESRWDDRKRNRAAAGAKRRAGSAERTPGALRSAPCASWRERSSGLELMEHLKKYRPISASCHMPAWFSWFVSNSNSAAAWIKYVTTKDKNALKDFLTKFAAEPWTIYESKREFDAVLKLCDDRPQGVVPGDNQTAILLMFIDTQDVGFWYEVRAFGHGLTEDSWQVRFGYVESFAALEKILLHSEYQDTSGNDYAIRKAVIDTGGHRAAAVFEWCRKMGNLVIPIKGADRQSAPLRWHKQEFYPGTNKQIPGGMQRLDIDVNFYKDKLSGKMGIAPDDPGAWRMCADCTEEWAKQMCSETIDEKTGRWVPITENRPNHAWDLGGYGLALADLLGVRFWRKDPAPEPEKRKAKKQSTKRKRW